MPSTYDKLAAQTLGSAATSVTFSSISGAYTDLILIVSSSNTLGSFYDNLLTFNGDTGSNYSWTRITGNGSAASSARGSSQTAIQVGWSGPAMTNNIIQIQNYTNSTTYKTTIARTNDAASNVAASVGLWQNTAAITSLTLTQFTGSSFNSGSTFTLYGIKAA
jgi:hypothetical protein